MKDEEFDNELSSLYQQRKSQVVAPDIPLSAHSETRRFSFIKLLSICTVGGMTSFGIMAIITHFAKPPKTPKPEYTAQHQINIEKEPLNSEAEQIISIKTELPPKPKSPEVISELDKIAPVKNSAPFKVAQNIAVNVVQVAKLPHLKEPELLIEPVYKVMPKFSQKSLQQGHSGAIKLRYEIDNNGQVEHIEVISSNVSRELQRSAKKALAKWKYKPKDNIKNSYEIIFEFN